MIQGVSILPGRKFYGMLLCLAIVVFGLTVPRVSQAENSIFTVQQIRIIGIERISRTTVLTYMPGIGVGQAVTPTAIAAAIRGLYQTGFFSRVQFRRDGNTLIVVVKERPTIAQVMLSGNKAIKTSDLKHGLEQAGLTRGQFFNRSALAGIASALVQTYFDHGRYGVKVDTKVKHLKNNRVAILFRMKEGSEAKVLSINFTGNHDFSSSTLRDQFKVTTPGWFTWISGKDKYDQEKLRGSLENLRSFYMNRGYADFRIDSAQVQISPDYSGIYINVNLHEGGKYTVGDIKLLGRFVIPEKQLRKMIFIKKGSSFSMLLATANATLLTNELGAYGYGFAKVSPIPRPNPKTHKVNLVFYMKPGQRVYVRHIMFEGAPDTDDAVFRREMRQSEGSWLNGYTLRRSKVRIQRLPFVDSVDIKPRKVPGSPDEVDVSVRVHQRQSGTAQATMSYSGYFGIGLGAQIALSNFLGQGDLVHINATRNSVQTNFSVSYTNPYATAYGVRRTTSVFYSQGSSIIKTTSQFDTKNYGGSWNYNFPLSEFDYYSMGVTFRHGVLTPFCGSSMELKQFVENPDNGGVTVVPSYCQGSDPAVPLDVNLSTLTYNNIIANLGFSHDTRNRTVFPTRGTFQQFNLGVATPLGNETYYTFNWRQMTFIPIKAGFVFGVQSQIGLAKAYGKMTDVPPYEHFFAGGPDTVAGYSTSTLGPYDSNRNPYGGNFITWVQNELILPNFMGGASAEHSYRVALFVDAGNVFARPKDFKLGDIRASYGIGFTWLTPIGALRFSYAKPFRYQAGDKLDRFQFTLGAYF